MARASAFVAGMVCGLVLGTAILVSHADPAEAEVAAAAAEAHVDLVDLEGALATTGMDDPYAYLRAVGDLPPLHPPPVFVDPMWDRLAGCESGGDWHSASNARYKGGLQEDATFWARYGGLDYAPAPHLATRAQQIAVAQRGLAAQGPGAWPVCGPRVGLHR